MDFEESRRGCKEYAFRFYHCVQGGNSSAWGKYFEWSTNLEFHVKLGHLSGAPSSDLKITDAMI
jgi:hypothetical protein